jgi:hypothetical protein
MPQTSSYALLKYMLLVCKGQHPAHPASVGRKLMVKPADHTARVGGLIN